MQLPENCTPAGCRRKVPLPLASERLRDDTLGVSGFGMSRRRYSENLSIPGITSTAVGEWQLCTPTRRCEPHVVSTISSYCHPEWTRSPGPRGSLRCACAVTDA